MSSHAPYFASWTRISSSFNYKSVTKQLGPVFCVGKKCFSYISVCINNKAIYLQLYWTDSGFTVGCLWLFKSMTYMRVQALFHCKQSHERLAWRCHLKKKNSLINRVRRKTRRERAASLQSLRDWTNTVEQKREADLKWSEQGDCLMSPGNAEIM